MPPPPHDSPRGGSAPAPSKPNEKLLSLILKAIIMMFLISFFFLLLPLASFLLLLPLLLRHQRNRHPHRHAHPSSGFSLKQLKRLPQFRFSQETITAHSESESCVICLDGFRQGQWCRNLVGCGHVFHRRCLDGWLTKVAACPICRRRVCLDQDDKPIFGFGSRRDFQGLLDM